MSDPAGTPPGGDEDWSWGVWLAVGLAGFFVLVGAGLAWHLWA